MQALLSPNPGRDGVVFPGAADPPPIPSKLVWLVADPSKGNVLLESASLRSALLQLGDWMKERLESSRQIVRGELDALIIEHRKAATASQEKALDTFRRSERETFEKISGLDVRLKEVEEKAREANMQVQEMKAAGGPAARGSSRFEEDARKLLEELKADAAAQSAQAMLRASEAQASTRSGAGAAAAVSPGVTAELKKGMAEMAKSVDQRLSALAGQTSKLGTDLRAKLSAVEKQQEKLQNDVGDRLAADVDRLSAELQAVAHLQSLDARAEDLERLGEEVRRLVRSKADKDSMNSEIEKLRQATDREWIEKHLSASNRGAEELGHRVRGLEQAVQAAERVRLSDKDSVQESLAQVDARFTSSVAQVAESGMAMEVRLNTHADELSHRLDDLKSQFVDLAGVLEDFQESAREADERLRAETSDLQNSLGSIAASMQDKKQAVLFGARCLSCNREFDDVDTGPGQVDLRRDKDRAHALAEITRALHTPLAKPSDTVRMIAVKVGRPSTVSSAAGGSFSGRDVSAAFGVNDAALLPVTPAGFDARWQASTAPKTPPPPGRRPRVIVDDCAPASPPKTAEAMIPEKTGGLDPPTPPPQRKEKKLPKLGLTQLLDRSAHVARSAR